MPSVLLLSNSLDSNTVAIKIVANTFGASSCVASKFGASVNLDIILGANRNVACVFFLLLAFSSITSVLLSESLQAFWC